MKRYLLILGWMQYLWKMKRYETKDMDDDTLFAKFVKENGGESPIKKRVGDILCTSKWNSSISSSIKPDFSSGFPLPVGKCSGLMCCYYDLMTLLYLLLLLRYI